MIWGRGLNICLEKANNSIYYCKRISVLTNIEKNRFSGDRKSMWAE